MSKHLRAKTINETAQYLGVSRDTIELHISAGTLRAVDVAAPGARKRCWRIPADAVIEFEQRRSNRPVPKPTRRQRRDPQVIQFF